MKIFHKSALSLAFVAFFAAFSASALEFSVRALPAFNLSWEENFDNSFGVTGALDFSAFTVRSRDSLFFTLQGNFSPINASGIDTVNVYDGSFGLGYEFRFHDRMSASLEALAGIWSIQKDDSSDLDSASGVSYGARAFYNFYVVPEFSVGAFAGFKYYSNSSSRFMGNTELGISLRYNFTKGLFAKSLVETSKIETSSLFPVFFSYYNEKGFGTVTFVNNEPTDLTDVEVLVYIEQFMSKENVAAKIGRVKRGEQFTADLTAFLDETILTNLTARQTDARISVRYKSLGRTKTYSQTVVLNALARNNMSWEDDRRAAAFVSGRDASAAMFARHVQSAVRDEVSARRNPNLYYAAALYGALKAYGMNYVIDPASAFVDNIGSSSIDFLQFPYQTILYHGGDCDDLSILNCALFEALGIETAFITVPGHIYMAFDSGVAPSDAASAVSDGMYIVQNGKVWIPLEITLCQDSFALARQTGFREWKKYASERKLIPLKDAWDEYKPVSIPDSDVKVELPSRAAILREYRAAIQ